MTRTEIATIHNWTLTRRDYDDHRDYIIQADEQRPLVNLFVSERNTYLRDENGEYIRDEDGQRVRKYVHEIYFTPVSRQLTLEEAAEYADLVQKALQAATTFKHLIEIMEEEEEAAEETV